MAADNQQQEERAICNGVPRKDTVLVTGFGPFGIHKVNASWEAVTELDKLGGLGDNINLVTKMIDVEYSMVDKCIPELWTQLKPKLVVHCGVSGIAKEIVLEQMAHQSGYMSEDVSYHTPSNNCCKRNGPFIIRSSIRMNSICEAINQSNCGVPAVLSQDPGRYLCDYTYYTSLSIDSRRTAFIHVPPLHRPFSAKELAAAIQIAIIEMLKQINEEEMVRSNSVMNNSVAENNSISHDFMLS